MTLGTDERREVAETDGQELLSDLQADGGDDDDDGQETCSLRERIRAELQPLKTLHSLNYSHRHGNVTYFVAVRTCSWDVSSGSSSAGGMLVRDCRTVVYDKETQDVRVTDNGLWVPEDSNAARAEGLLRSFSRTVTDARSDDEHDTLVQDMSSRQVDVDSVLSQEVPVPRDDSGDGYTQDVDSMREHEGIDPSRSWGYYAGAPPEAEHVADRLREAGLQPDEHLIRLRFGQKRPFDTVDSDEDVPTRGYETSDLLGNYGVDCLSQDAGLVCVDVDSPDAFPFGVDLPETFSISSPHGDDERRHLLFYCPDKDELADELGAWSVNDATNAQGDVWGDLWAGANRYVVGAGCQIGAHACNKGDAEVPKDDGCNADGCDSWLGCEACRAGCDVCSDEQRGYYRIVQDVPIATVDADTLLQLVPEGEVDDEQQAGNQLSNGLPDAEQEGYVRTSCCDSVLPEDATFSVGDRHMCCDGHGCAGGD